jgi:tRNA (guanine-N7-)-methyltransferase
MPHELWYLVFGNARPVEIEIGPGRGDVLDAFAHAYPGINFFGIEVQPWYAERAQARAEHLGLPNVRVIAGDARCVVGRLVPAGSVQAFHIYFPDPWPKKRHTKRRLFTPTFATDLRRALALGGLVYVATDVEETFGDMRSALLSAGFTPDRSTPTRIRPMTRFEAKYAAAGTHQATFRTPLPAARQAAPSPQNIS